MERDKDPFEGLGWRAKIIQLVDPYILFNPLLEYRVSYTK